jgi:hypothetical protein
MKGKFNRKLPVNFSVKIAVERSCEVLLTADISAKPNGAQIERQRTGGNKKNKWLDIEKRYAAYAAAKAQSYF